MIPTRRFDQELPELLMEASTAPYPDYIDDVLGGTSRMRQRPAWTFPGRWLPMDLTIPRRATVVPGRPLLLLALVALLVAVLVVVAAGSRRPLPPPFGVADNGLIAYTADGDILVVDPTVGVPRAIVTGADDAAVTYSPRGDRLAFVRRIPGGMIAMVGDTDGRAIREIGRVAVRDPAGDLMAFEWAPDGSRIAFGYKEDGREVLDIVRTDGNGSSRVVVDGDIRDPVWRPSEGGQFVARVAWRAGGADYVLFDADGTHPRPLALPKDPEVDESPDHVLIAQSWSPDGTRLVYNTAHIVGGLGVQRIHVARIDAAGTVTEDRRYEYDRRNDVEGWALWSPDGSRFVLNASPADADPWRVAVANSDGTGPLTYLGRETLTPQAMGHAWSPDGTTIIAKYIEEHEAWLFDPAGGPGRQVDWWAADGDGPSWQRVSGG
jgi:Tol biopolymer transport system component